MLILEHLLFRGSKDRRQYATSCRQNTRTLWRILPHRTHVQTMQPRRAGWPTWTVGQQKLAGEVLPIQMLGQLRSRHPTTLIFRLGWIATWTEWDETNATRSINQLKQIQLFSMREEETWSLYIRRLWCCFNCLYNEPYQFCWIFHFLIFINRRWAPFFGRGKIIYQIQNWTFRQITCYLT